MKKIIRVAVLLFVFASFGTGKTYAQKKGMRIGPHTIVYKTRANYRKLVPIELSADKKHIISYPAPSDLKTGNSYMLPLALHKGYMLDQKGIGKNTAFLKLTYEQYAALKQAPSLNEMYKMIVDKNPITEYYDCGMRYNFPHAVKQINRLIDKHLLKKQCKLIL